MQGDKTQYTEKQFTEFLLVVESSPLRSYEESDGGGSEIHSPSMVTSSLRRTGSFQLLGDVLTRFSDHCTNTVTQTSSVAKSEIQVLWTAPPAGSGCVTFKVTVVENRCVGLMTLLFVYIVCYKAFSKAGLNHPSNKACSNYSV